jgi:hypothetical protein
MGKFKMKVEGFEREMPYVETLTGLTEQGFVNYEKHMEKANQRNEGMQLVEVDGKTRWAIDFLVLWMENKRYYVHTTDIRQWPISKTLVDFMEVERHFYNNDGEELYYDDMTEHFNKGEGYNV